MATWSYELLTSPTGIPVFSPALVVSTTLELDINKNPINFILLSSLATPEFAEFTPAEVITRYPWLGYSVVYQNTAGESVGLF